MYVTYFEGNFQSVIMNQYTNTRVSNVFCVTNTKSFQIFYTKPHNNIFPRATVIKLIFIQNSRKKI